VHHRDEPEAVLTGSRLVELAVRKGGDRLAVDDLAIGAAAERPASSSSKKSYPTRPGGGRRGRAG